MAAFSGNGRLLFLLLAMACFLSAAAGPHALSENDKKAATQLLIEFEGSISSLEEKYQLLRSFEVLGMKREELITCDEVGKILALSKFSPKDIFYASKIGETLLCSFSETDLKATASNLLSYISSSDSLLDLRFSIGALSLMKNWINDDLILENAVAVFHKIKALGEEDGTWKYGANDDGTSPKAAGLALETLAYLITIASPSIDDAKIRYIRGAASKLFDFIEKYEDGTHYFVENSVDALHGEGGPLAATSCVVKGVTAIASATSGKLEISAEKIVGVANFFLIAGIQGSQADLFHALDALGGLDKSSFLVPLVLSVHPSVLSLTAKDTLKVLTTTVLGSPVAATVTLRKAVRATEKNPVLNNQELESDENKAIHRFDLVHKKVDIGTYDLTFKVKPLEDGKYAAVTSTTARILVTGVASISEVEVGVLDSDTGSTDFMKRWDPSTKEVVSLFATHLQKLCFSLDVLSPFQEPFKPHQVFVKLRHESKLEHLFLLKPKGKKLELSLDLLGLVEKLNYLSGVYTMELIIGDAAMENPAIWSLGTVELDLPEAPEGVMKPSAIGQAPSTYVPKPEITHMFRPADKRAPPTLSTSFFILSLVPLLAFLIGLKLLNTNIKSFPSSGLPMLAALVFHVGIASVLGLYVLFWLKFNLFQTLKLLGVLATVLTVPGYYLLSHLADSPSAKIKSA